MKGRSLRGTWMVTPLVIVVIGSISGLLAGCSGNDDQRAVLPAESIQEAALIVPDTTPAVVVTTPETTSAPSTTAAPTTVPATTGPPTVVETLPQPAPPPEPRAEEPYQELGTLEIPKLNVIQPLLEGITLNTLDRGPGHWPGTAMPGHLGNVVVAGHRTSHGKVFRNIDQLVAGDEVILTTGEGRFVYVVTTTEVVQPDALHIIEQTQASTATLFACHPPGSTRQRIVVTLQLQADPPVTG